MNDNLDAHASQLVDNDTQLHDALIAARISQGLTVATVAERMGMSEAQVLEFESYDSDPRLSVVRRYVMAIGAEITSTVIEMVPPAD